MANKTPYELRFDMLQMARGHLTDQYFADLEIVRSMAMNQDIHGQTMDRDGAYRKEYTSRLGKFPTLEEAMKLANKIRDFVDDTR